ncbi:MAG: MBL fold metallo-hydrolase [Bacillota bacterium]
MIEKVVDNFYFIERGWLNGNQFVFNGKAKVLIDTGYKRDLQRTLHLIQQTGVDIRQVELIISTHCHCDHIGANRYIQELSGCEIGMHLIDRNFIQTKNDWYTWWRYYDQEADFFTVNRSFTEGDVIRLDDLELVVLHTPGHASGQIALYSPQHRFLLSADAVWDGDFGVLTTRIEGNISPFLHQQSLEKLSSLDLSVIYPGHGSPIYDPKGAIDRCRRRLESFINEPERLGRDQMKKIILYTLLAKSGLQEEGFFEYLNRTHWFREAVDLFFNGQYRPVYEDVLSELISRKLVRRENGRLVALLEA